MVRQGGGEGEGGDAEGEREGKWVVVGRGREVGVSESTAQQYGHLGRQQWRLAAQAARPRRICCARACVRAGRSARSNAASGPACLGRCHQERDRGRDFNLLERASSW